MEQKFGVREIVLREEPTDPREREANPAPFIELALHEGTSSAVGRRILEWGILFIENCRRLAEGKVFLHDFFSFSHVLLEDVGHGERVTARNNRGRWAPEKVLQLQLHTALLAQQYGIPLRHLGPKAGRAKEEPALRALRTF